MNVDKILVILLWSCLIFAGSVFLYAPMIFYLSLEKERAVKEIPLLREDLNRKLELLDDGLKELNHLKEELKNESREIR